MKVTKEQINSFIEGKPIAIAGVSRSPRKFGYQVFNELKKKGYEVIPVNPHAETIDNDLCYKSVDDLPEQVESLLIVTQKNQTDAVLRDAIRKGIKNIWVQQMSETADTIRIAEEYSIELITGKCIFMFAEPVTGFHKFHRTLMKWFGRLPK